MKKLFVLMVLISAFLISGCSQKKVVRSAESEMQQQQPAAPSAETAEKKGSLKPEERITERQLAKIETKEELPQYKEESGLFADIHFDYDQYDIRQDARPVLENIASWLIKNQAAKIMVEGHCDERGTNEYNLALGDRRAKAVRDYLIALGIAPDRIETISYGEEKPLCPETTEECWAKNRRAHFVVLREEGK